VETVTRGRLAPRCLAALCVLALGGAARADEPEAVGRFIPVPARLSGDAIERIRQTVEDEFKKFKDAEQQRELDRRRVFKVVYDSNPDGRPNRSDNFGFCLKLAEDIRGLKGVQTTAFVHGEVGGHTVLPVLACQQLVMSSKAKLGPVLLSGRPALEDYQAKAYAHIGDRLNPVLVRKFFDKDLVVVAGKDGGFAALGSDAAAPGARTVMEGGKAAEFTFAKAKEVGLCELDPRETREEVARAYRLPRESLQENPLLGRIVAWQIPVAGEVNGALREQVKRRVRRAERGGANFIVLELKCHGGDPAIANDIAKYLLGLNEKRPDNPLVTIAYVTKDAQDTATYLAPRG